MGWGTSPVAVPVGVGRGVGLGGCAGAGAGGGAGADAKGETVVVGCVDSAVRCSKGERVSDGPSDAVVLTVATDVSRGDGSAELLRGLERRGVVAGLTVGVVRPERKVRPVLAGEAGAGELMTWAQIQGQDVPAGSKTKDRERSKSSTVNL